MICLIHRRLVQLSYTINLSHVKAGTAEEYGKRQPVGDSTAEVYRKLSQRKQIPLSYTTYTLC